MFGVYYNHDIIRKYVIAFGSLFNNIKIKRFESNGTIKEELIVPIMYGPKEKYLSKIKQNPANKKSTAITLPKISFEMEAPSFDSERKLNELNRFASRNVDGSFNDMYTGSPWNFEFQLNIFVKNTTDGTQIVEQILPYFTPSFQVSIKLIPEMNITRTIPIILSAVSTTDDYEGDYISRRSVIWTLNFTLKGYLFPAIKSGSNLIQHSDIRLGIINKDNTNTPTENISSAIIDPLEYGTNDFGYTQFIQDI